MKLNSSGPLKQEYIIHIMLWCGVLLFPYIKFIELEGGYPETFLHELNSIFFIILPSYAFYLWWLPLTSKNKLNWLPVLLLIFVGTIFAYEYSDSLFHDNNYQPFSWNHFLSDVIKISAFILFFLVLFLVKGLLKQKEEIRRVSEAKKSVEQEAVQAHSKSTIDEIHYLYADKTTYKVKSSEIRFIKAEIDYVKVVCIDKEILILDSLRKWKDKLNKQGFIQSHRSYLVNLNGIISISKNEINLKDHTLPIGPTYKAELVNAFKQVTSYV
ncbi:LytR/AlgR family response regulator transcription factor [Roseivirga sp.]|uniref:LytR/AlgR family response regulator transcription factor n=1 Tax=Roseivirga sp. TaxID=1964215 RepID=UPI003B8C99E2